MADFNPNSTDAMFSRILTELQEINGKVDEVKVEARKTNGRVTALERDRWYQRGVVASIAVAVPAAWEYFKSR